MRNLIISADMIFPVAFHFPEKRPEYFTISKMRRLFLLSCLFLMLSSCVTYKRCEEKFGMHHSRDSLVEMTIQADSVSASLPISIGNPESRLKDWQYANGIRSRLKYRIVRDTTTNRDTILMVAECLPETVSKTVTVKQIEFVDEIKQPSAWAVWWSQTKNIITGLVISSLLIGLLIFLLSLLK